VLPNRFHQKECHATTNQQSSKKRSSQGALAGGYMKHLFVKHTKLLRGPGALGCIRNRKTEEKIVQNRKTAKKFTQN